MSLVADIQRLQKQRKPETLEYDLQQELKLCTHLYQTLDQPMPLDWILSSLQEKRLLLKEYPQATSLLNDNYKIMVGCFL